MSFAFCRTLRQCSTRVVWYMPTWVNTTCCGSMTKSTSSTLRRRLMPCILMQWSSSSETAATFRRQVNVHPVHSLSLLVFDFKCICLDYLSDLFCCYHVSFNYIEFNVFFPATSFCPLRSSDRLNLFVPHVGPLWLNWDPVLPSLWNSLPPAVCSTILSGIISSSFSRLKSCLFSWVWTHCFLLSLMVILSYGCVS